MHRVGYLLTEGFQVMALATQSVFEFANIVTGKAVYKVQNFSQAGGIVSSSLGLHVDTLPLTQAGLADSWLVAGGWHADSADAARC
jgi:transcriptional regulator GlxA family with amidase domain